MTQVSNSTKFHVVPRETVIGLLQSQLPQSLSLFRRVQSAPRSPHTLVVATFPEGEVPQITGINEGNFDIIDDIDVANKKKHTLIHNESQAMMNSDHLAAPFMVAEIDISPETFGTNVWVYSSYERFKFTWQKGSQIILESQFRGLVSFLRALNEDNGYGKNTGNPVIFGALHQSFVQIIKTVSTVTRVSPAYYKQLFIMNEEKDLYDAKRNQSYDRFSIRPADDDSIQIILGTSKIPRDRNLMLQRPNICLHDSIDNETAAWCFLSTDGSLITLYVRDKYRGQGLAKRSFLELVNTKMFDLYGTKGIRTIQETVPQWKWVHADVEIDNEESKGVCKSVGCKISWITHWLDVDLSV